MTGKTVGIVMIVTAFCVVGYRWYRSFRKTNAVEMVNVGGGNIITISSLPGYCNELDRDFFSPLERADPSRYVIAVSAPCRELTEFKIGTATGLQRYIVWSVAATDNGTPTRVPANITRSGFVNEMAESQKKIDLAEIASEVAENGSRIGVIDEGLIDHEADAVYLAAVISGNNGGTVKASVTGSAEIHHLGLGITAYDGFRSSTTVSELLASVKALMHAALSDNSES